MNRSKRQRVPVTCTRSRVGYPGARSICWTLATAFTRFIGSTPPWKWLKENPRQVRRLIDVFYQQVFANSEATDWQKRRIRADLRRWMRFGTSDTCKLRTIIESWSQDKTTHILTRWKEYAAPAVNNQLRALISHAWSVPNCFAVKHAHRGSSSRRLRSRFALPDILWTSYVPNQFYNQLSTLAIAAVAWAPFGRNCLARPSGLLQRRAGIGAAVNAMVGLSRRLEKRDGRSLASSARRSFRQYASGRGPGSALSASHPSSPVRSDHPDVVEQTGAARARARGYLVLHSSSAVAGRVQGVD